MTLDQTLDVLQWVLTERLRQHAKHGDAMSHLPSGTGPEEVWLEPLCGDFAPRIQRRLRTEYEGAEKYGQLTRMHLVREEIAEAFELDESDPNFAAELIQVAALCVQWVEILRDERAGPVAAPYGPRCWRWACREPADEVWFSDGSKGIYCSEHAEAEVMRRAEQ